VLISIAIYGAICGPLNNPGGFAENQSNKVIGKIPDLDLSAYTLEIVTQYSGGGRALEEPCTVIFPGELTVPDKERPAISVED
jgi:hypothetical protein